MFEVAIFNAGGELYEVGGTVRDRLLGIEHKDKDLLVRGIPLEKLIALLKPYGKVALVGKSFGIIKFSPYSPRNTTYDIAIPRKETSTGIGHREFQIECDCNLPIEADLSRRDFTINAMAWHTREKRLIDPFKGKQDLENKLLRQVFESAFVEDPLRLLRAVQFATRFGLTIEKNTFQSMCRYSNLIKSVTAERIIVEIEKLLRAEQPSRGFEIMRKCNLLDYIFPELKNLIGITQDKQPYDDVWKHTMRTLDTARSDSYLKHKGDLELMMAALLHDTGKFKCYRLAPEQDRVVFYGHQIVSKRIAARRLTKLKASTIGLNIDNVCRLIENHMFDTKANFTDRAIRRFINKMGKELIFKLLDLRLCDNRAGKYPGGIRGVLRLRKRIEKELQKKPPFSAKDLKISGHDIMALGIPEGPLIGKILAQLVELVLDNPSLNNKEELLRHAKHIIDNSTLEEG